MFIIVTQSRSTLSELRSIFEHQITAAQVAVPLESIPVGTDAEYARKLMQDNDFDLMGVTVDGSVTGFIARDQLTRSQMVTEYTPFSVDHLVPDSAPLLDVLERLSERAHLFVMGAQRAVQIITRGDLQKIPFRMMLYMMVSLLEIQMLRLIKFYYPDNSWKPLISPARLLEAEEFHAKRVRQNEQLNLVDALQFADKRVVLLKTDGVVQLIASSKRKAEASMKTIESLRNILAHPQDLRNEFSWAELLDVTQEVQRLLLEFEGIGLQQAA